MTDNKFYTSDEEMPIFISEEIEPMTAMCIGRWYARCEAARKVKAEVEQRVKDENRNMTSDEDIDCRMFLRECINWWWGMDAINKLSIATKGAVHFSIASSNEMRHVANYIKKYLGVCPISEKEKAREFGFSIK